MVGGIHKNLYLIIWEGVLRNGNRANRLQFFLRTGIALPPAIRFNSNIKKCGLHLWRTVCLHLNFHLFLLWISTESKTNNHFHNILRLFDVLTNFPFKFSAISHENWSCPKYFVTDCLWKRFLILTRPRPHET